MPEDSDRTGHIGSYLVRRFSLTLSLISTSIPAIPRRMRTDIESHQPTARPTEVIATMLTIIMKRLMGSLSPAVEVNRSQVSVG